ncbi:hypothetical protein C8C83_3334 [Flavobacterium sp. 90]|uniref:hypothetical protein n=1 Tax=unclassified Flavobacterium TaxID=196869 RepID=UPI000EB45031|nr:MULTISPECIES: hypothetical protein [unclassified Flavobacterium]RKR11594.1 hypothetical protein C8C82_3645 [Flavobacterium sp. 81]TCK55375.1 hypothetical protein C8C83_3334 [Flavobacterium sp. 90]
MSNNKREKLFDGFESDIIHQTFEIAYANKKIKFKVTDFIDNSLKDLLNYINESELNQILSDLNLSKVDSFIPKYKSVDNLDMYFCVKEDVLFLFSYGEMQPMRYVMFLEGIYNLKI